MDINIVLDDITESLEVFTATLTNPQTSLQDITIIEPSTISITVSDCEWVGKLSAAVFPFCHLCGAHDSCWRRSF